MVEAGELPNAVDWTLTRSDLIHIVILNCCGLPASSVVRFLVSTIPSNWAKRGWETAQMPLTRRGKESFHGRIAGLSSMVQRKRSKTYLLSCRTGVIGPNAIFPTAFLPPACRR